MNHRLQLLILCGFLILSACQTTTLSQWHWERAEAGLPRQAIILTVAVDPLDPDRLWAGYYAPGGLATSVDGGQTWATGSEGLGDNPVFDLLVSSAVEGDKERVKLWAATRDGLLGSVDAGANWQPATGDLPAVTAFALAVDATGRLYVGLDGAGVYAETQPGQIWKALTPSYSLPAGQDEGGNEAVAPMAVLALAVSPDGQQLYAGTPAQGVFASQDGGRTWVATYPGEYAPNVALNPTQPTLAVASLRDRLVRTHDGGQSWHTVPVPWARDEIVSLLWLADGTLGAGTGQGRLYRSLDGGDSWVEGGAGLPPGSVLALSATEEQSANGPGRLLAGTWTGVYASDDGGQTWSYLAPSVGTPNAQTLLNTKAGLLLGTRTGLFRWQPDSRHWTPVGDELPSGVASLAADPVDGQILYAGTSGDGLYRSDDAGTSWQRLPSLGVGIPAVAVDPADAAHLYILAVWERVYESRNRGQNWLARWDGLGDVIEAVSLATDPLNPIAYVGTETGLYRSRGSEDWEPVAPTLADQSILTLMPHAIQSATWRGSILYIGTTRGAYRSLDSGQTVQGGARNLGWGRGLENVSVTAFLADPYDPRQLYAGTAYAGVYQSVDGGQTWRPIGPTELAEDVVEALAWGPGGELFVAAASGVWRGERP